MLFQEFVLTHDEPVIVVIPENLDLEEAYIKDLSDHSPNGPRMKVIGEMQRKYRDVRHDSFAMTSKMGKDSLFRKYDYMLDPICKFFATFEDAFTWQLDRLIDLESDV